MAAEVRASARPRDADAALRALERAVLALRAGRDAEAVRAAEEAKGLAPRSGGVREVLGMALYRRARYRDAVRELRAYRRITGRVDQNHLLADSHRALEEPEQAVPLAREAVTAPVPREVRAEAAVVGAAALADLGRYEEALSMLRRVTGRSDVAGPPDLRVWYVTGDVLERAGRPREAARQFARIVRHDAHAFDAAERLEALGGRG